MSNTIITPEVAIRKWVIVGTIEDDGRSDHFPNGGDYLSENALRSLIETVDLHCSGVKLHLVSMKRVEG